MKRIVSLAAAGGMWLALASLLVGQVRVAAEPGQDTKKSGAQDRSSDEAAIRQSAAEFAKAVEKGDIKAVVALWTENGEFIGPDGDIISGRAALEKAYTESLAKKKSTRLELTIDTIRFPSKDTAIEEGHAKSFKSDSDQPTSTRYSVLHVREDGRWLVAVLREWADESASLHDLEWLIGTWEAKTDDTDVRTAYSWDAKKNSIRCEITIKGQGRDVSASQFLLKDPRTNQVRAWLFDDDGGFGDSTWNHDGTHWIINATGVQADGAESTARNIITVIDKDTFTWQSTERTLDGETLPNIPPIKVRRVK